MLETLLIISVLVLVIVILVMQYKLPVRSAQMLEQQHRAMLSDLHDGLNKQGDRLIASQDRTVRAVTHGSRRGIASHARGNRRTASQTGHATERDIGADAGEVG